MGLSLAGPQAGPAAADSQDDKVAAGAADAGTPPAVSQRGVAARHAGVLEAFTSKFSYDAKVPLAEISGTLGLPVSTSAV